MSILQSTIDFLIYLFTCGRVHLFISEDTSSNNGNDDQLRIPVNPVSFFNISTTHLDSPIKRRQLMSKSQIDYSSSPWNIDFSKIESRTEYVKTNNNHLIYTHCLIPKNIENIKGMIFYCHGYGSHSNWTEIRIGTYYCQKMGYIFMMHDYYGHGQSDGKWMYIDSFDTFINDAQYIFEWSKKKYSNYLKHLKTPNYFLMGVSMGGGISILLSLRYKSGLKSEESGLKKNSARMINGMILLAPMVRIETKMVPSKMVGNIFIFLLRNVPYIGNFMVLPGRRLTPFNSRIFENNQFIVDNPLYFNYRPRLRSAWTIKCACEEIESKLKEVKVPLFVCHGGDDQVLKLDGSEALFKHAQSEDKEFKIYENAYHILHLDSASSQVYDDISEWMAKRLHK